MYAAVPGEGLLSSDDAGDSWSALPGTDGFVDFRFDVNSAGTLIVAQAGQGIFSCSESGCEQHGSANLAGPNTAPIVLPDDRVLVPPFLSVPSTDW